MKVKSLFRPLYRAVIRNVRLLSLFTAKALVRPHFIASRLHMSYRAGKKFDGLGAQLQRVLAINGLANYLSLDSISRPIEAIAIHPLDELDSSSDYEKFMLNVNSVIGASESSRDSRNLGNCIYVNDLRLRDICRAIIRIFMKRQVVELQVTHPYRFVDTWPNMYVCLANGLIANRLKYFADEASEPTIVLHYRHGVGGAGIQPGQSQTRELGLREYRESIKAASRALGIRQISVYTDAPLVQTRFTPPTKQISEWSGLPGFDGTRMEIKGNSLDDLTVDLPCDFKIKRGGNPLISLANMAAADALILSRSSFSYVAALLSRSIFVWMPRDFWHPSLPGWSLFK